MQWEFSVRSCGSVCNKPPLHKRGDVEIINYLQDTAGARNLVFNLSITHDRYGSSSNEQHTLLSFQVLQS